MGSFKVRALAGNVVGDDFTKGNVYYVEDGCLKDNEGYLWGKGRLNDIHSLKEHMSKICGKFEFELVEEDEKMGFSKSDLKNGMVVVLRDGRKGLILNELYGCKWMMVGDNANISSDTWYRDDLTNRTTASRDIMKVYKPRLSKITSLDISDAELLFEREESIPMTLKEIESKLGHAVKIVY